MPVTTISAAVHITPVVVRTFFSHGKKKAKKYKDGSKEAEATDDVFFDQAFHIVKAFIEMGTTNTIESLQAFTNTHVPAPYWAAVAPVLIPLSSCNRAADILIDWFGPLELKQVVGGERWWQVRGLDGLDAEWVTETKYLASDPVINDVERKLSTVEETILKMDTLKRVMLYIHGGGYFWGSINTHRYQIIRYARKIQGRVFAVNYRKAPQYPWPCPLQDVIAAYLYLIEPPPGSLHSPVSPSQIVLAGDSAGGGLCLTALTVIRDLGLPLPAGAVLISPWVDLTHSFPSVMSHTKTDIIPQYGFLAKPSVLWPVDPIPPQGGRVTTAKSNLPPAPGHSDTLKPSQTRVANDVLNNSTIDHEERVLSQAEMLKDKTPESGCSTTSAADSRSETTRGQGEDNEYDVDRWEPKPPKVLMKDPDAVPLELHSQIQLYATNEQLSHPLVSPILQGSLGNLPPLFILAGDKEVLRDEILYLAHRAAYPDEFRARRGVLRDGHRQKENAERFTEPTKVHLQVYDGMCHVLTVFSFTQSAKYAYRAIAQFVKHVTDNPDVDLEKTYFPDLQQTQTDVSGDAVDTETSSRSPSNRDKAAPSGKISSAQDGSSSSHTNEVNGISLTREADGNPRDVKVSSNWVSPPSKHIPSKVCMLKERVDVRGRIRALEPQREMDALKTRPSEVAVLKEEPALRWLKGQEIWDNRYKTDALKVLKQRQRLEAKAKRMLDHAREQGLILSGDGMSMPRRESLASTRSQRTTRGEVQPDRRWGPLDLDDEHPPPSAIAKRRDTPEALALLKKSIYHTAPITHQTIPRRKIIDAVRAAFDPNDNPIKAPKQSVSEQQTTAHIIPMHGLKIWDALISYFARKSSKSAANGTKYAAEIVRGTKEQLEVRLNLDSGA